MSSLAGLAGCLWGSRQYGSILSRMKAVARAMARPEDHNPTRTDILDAATRLIVKSGYSSCTMRAVADAVNIRAASLYHHFASKDDIVAEILNQGIAVLLEEVTTRLDALPQGTPFAQLFETAVQSHISCMTGTFSQPKQVYEHLPPLLKRKRRAMRDRYAKLWFGLLQAGVDEGVVDSGLNLGIAVPYIFGGLNRVPEWFRGAKFPAGGGLCGRSRHAMAWIDRSID
jgi:AcrR family transcriptional regulator